MKNKVIFRMISLALLIFLCLGAIACGKGGDEGDNTSDTVVESTSDNSAETTGENGGNNGGSSALSGDEALFAEMLSAYEASVSYTGAVTIKGAQDMFSQQGEEIYDMTQKSTVSIDLEKDLYFENETIERNDEGNESTHIAINKLFAVDGVLYEYDKSKDDYANQEPIEAEIYYKDAKSMTDEEYAKDLAASFNGIVGGISKAKTYDQLKAAFTKVFSEIKARELAEYKEDGALKDGATITIEPAVSIKKADGETVLTVVATFKADELADDSHTLIKNYIITYTRVISVKGGKINRLSMDYDMSADITETGDSGAVESIKYASKLETAYDFTYSFDQEGYDAITVSLPTDPTQIFEAVPEKSNYVNLHIGENAVYKEHVSDFDEIPEWFAYIVNNARGNYGAEYIYENGDEIIVNKVTINGFYKDAARTQKINTETITRDELLALGDVYIDATISDTVAIVYEEYNVSDELSLEYQIAASGMSSYSMSAPMNEPKPADPTRPYDIRDTDNTNEYRVFVNGVETSGNTIAIEGGKTYYIKKIRLVKDIEKDMNHIIPELY